jgi:B12-binding domain/radical SAM domain protein
LKGQTALVFPCPKPNRYSINALLGAIEADPALRDIEVFLVEEVEALHSCIGEIVGRYRKAIVGISFFSTQVRDVGGLISELRTSYPGVLYIAGGPHPSADPADTLGLGFDIVVKGEGEETLPALLRAIERGGDLARIKGIVYSDPEPVFTGPRPPVDLNRYPPFSFRHRRVGPIEITRGCPNHCLFCQTPRLFGHRPRHRGIHQIVEYVRLMRERNLRDIRFITPDAFSYGSPDGRTLTLSAIEALLGSVREVIGREGRIFFGSFPSEVRPEHVNSETVALVVRYADNDNLVIGAQSGSQRILERCRRGHGVEDIYQAVEHTLSAGLKPYVDFIFGLPGEEEEDIRETIRVMEDLVEMGARIHTHTFMPLPGTPFAHESPGRISQALEDVINRLTASGKAFGSWRHQYEIASRIPKTCTS